jgi:hypothetical protein
VVWNVLGRLLVRARCACNIPSSGCKYIPPQHDRFAGGGTNAMDVFKNVRDWRCTRFPARHQACCPGGGLILLVAWASADVRQVLLQQLHARHPSPILEGLLSLYRLVRGVFANFCRSFVFVSFAWLRLSAYGAPARLADSTSWISCFATSRWSVVTLDPGNKKKQMNNPFYYSLTRRSRVKVLPTRARNNDNRDRRRIVSNMR